MVMVVRAKPGIKKATLRVVNKNSTIELGQKSLVQSTLDGNMLINGS